MRPATLSKKRLSHRCFPVDFAKLLRTPFLQNTSWTLKEIWNREPVTKILTNLGVLIFPDLKCSSHITRFVCDRGRSVRFPSTDVMRKTFKKIRPRIINHRSLKHFSNETCKIFLKTLSKEVYVNDDRLEVLRNNRRHFEKQPSTNKTAAIKKKHVRGNQMALMTEQHLKEVMARWRL